MPGAYAHITLVNLAREPARLDAGPGIPPVAGLALGKWLHFVELGAVSPDYPYLALTESANRWADLMHYERTGTMVQTGVKLVRGLSGLDQEKALAWLCGYAAHVVTDATIHPVVELKVGPYAGNEQAHRICEMHQDAYIYQRLGLGDVGLSEHLTSGIERCTASDGGLDPTISSLWRRMLKATHADEFATNSPDLDAWHRGFSRMVNHIAEEGYRLLPLARHVAVGCGLTYPAAVDIDHATYISSLATPHGRASYDEVFDKALTHVTEAWQLIASGVYESDSTFLTAFGDWNLDTGRDGNKTIVLWA